MDLKLGGKTALITGASMGIGEHLAETFAAEGVNLHLTARSTDKLAALRDRIKAVHDVDITLHSADLSQPGTCETLSEAVGTVDILVNNAG
ncbi:MAG: short-subunit dehydrogenase, partial [Pseudorhodobacter sp.]